MRDICRIALCIRVVIARQSERPYYAAHEDNIYKSGKYYPYRAAVRTTPHTHIVFFYPLPPLTPCFHFKFIPLRSFAIVLPSVL